MGAITKNVFATSATHPAICLVCLFLFGQGAALEEMSHDKIYSALQVYDMACQPCYGVTGTLAGLVVAFLVAIYLLGLRKMGAWESGKDFNLPISAALAQTPTTYGLSIAMAVLVAVGSTVMECVYPIPLARASIPVVAIFGTFLVISICVTWKRQRTVHYVFTGLALALMVAAAGLWTHASWKRSPAMRTTMTIVTVMLGVASLGAGISFSLRTKQKWLAVTEWVSVALFMVALVCSCSVRNPPCGPPQALAAAS